MLDLLRHIVQFLVSHLLIAVTLSLGLAIDLHEVKTELRRSVFWRGLLVALVAVPLLTMIIVKALPLRPAAAGVLILMAVSPGAPLAVRRVRGQKGNVPLAMALSVTLLLALIGVLPGTLWLVNRLFPIELQASPGQLFKAVVPPMLVPLAVGFALRQWVPGFARRLQPVVDIFTKVAFGVAVVLLLLTGLRELRVLHGWVLIAMILTTCGAALLGHVAGRPRSDDQMTLATAVVIGNPVVALLIASVSYPELKLTPVVALYILLRILLFLPYQHWLQRRLTRRPPERPAPPLVPGRRIPSNP